MRISDEELNAKLDAALKKSLKAIDIGRIVQAESLFHDLRDARAEIAQLKKDKAELISCIEDLKK